MRILFLNYIYDDRVETPEKLIETYRVVHEWCHVVKQKGADSVTVLQRFNQNASLQKDGVEYKYVDDGLNPILYWWSRPNKVNTMTAELKPDVIHVNGIAFFLKELRTKIKNGTAILWQSHFNRTPSIITRRLWRQALQHSDGVILTSSRQADPWKKSGIMNESLDLFEVPGASTHFKPLSYSQCRSELGMNNQSVYLWVGRLHDKKDPLTVIKGFSRIVQSDRNAYLYMIYGSTELISDVHKAIAEHSLRDHVQLIGYIPHYELPKYYSASDYFVLGSRAEVCGFALIEALSCGVTPVVTDIPSFRKITGDGAAGYLWQSGDPESFVHASNEAKKENISRDYYLSFFKDNLSYEVLGNKVLNIYSDAYQKRQKRME